ncbi:MAG TPA: 30S ribosome-binding factor RbfA [Candidatus Deferrimicrobium sp.]|nr:30S ribosome-binding factor RbfA [Candidatus Deferrimicrobium sp.]
MQQFKRSERLGEQMLRDISSLMQNDLADEVPAMVTFTHVKLSDDLRYATVNYSVLGSEQDRQAADVYFSQEKKRIQHLVGRSLRLRRIPELSFKFDPSVAEGVRIEQLLNEIKRHPQQQ